MKMNRRDFIKANAALAAAAVAGAQLPATQKALTAEGDKDIRWDKAPCRFCGTGCGVLVGTRNGKIVATQGDPDAPVNRGLNCIKGYFLTKIMYGKDRVTQPLLRKKNGRFDKEGDFEPVSWDEAFDVMAEKWKAAIKQGLEENKGKPPEEITSRVGMFGSGQWTVWEGYAANKLMKAGFRSNNIDPNARHCMASAVVAFIQGFGIDEPAGNYDDIEHTDTVITWGANMAECHPILWARVSDRRLGNDNVKLVNLTTISNQTSDIADTEIIFKPGTDLAIQNYILREIIRNDAVNHDFVNKHCVFATGPYDIGYGMRGTSEFAFEAEKDIQAKELVVTLDKDEAIAQRKEIFYPAAAGSDPVMWHDIFLANREAVLHTLDDFRADLDALRAAVDEGDGHTLLGVFTRAKAAREHFSKILARRAYVDVMHSKDLIFLANPGGSLRGQIRVPGDKSISHRSIMLGSLAAQNPSRYRADARQDRQQYNVCRGKIWHSLFPLHG